MNGWERYGRRWSGMRPKPPADPALGEWRQRQAEADMAAGAPEQAAEELSALSQELGLAGQPAPADGFSLAAVGASGAREEPAPDPGDPDVLGYVVARTDGKRVMLTHASVLSREEADGEAKQWRRELSAVWETAVCEIRRVR